MGMDIEGKVAELMAEKRVNTSRLNQMETTLAQNQKILREVSKAVVELAANGQILARIDKQVNDMQPILMAAAQVSKDITRHSSHIEQLFDKDDKMRDALSIMKETLRNEMAKDKEALTLKIEAQSEEINEIKNEPAKEALAQKRRFNYVLIGLVLTWVFGLITMTIGGN